MDTSGGRYDARYALTLPVSIGRGDKIRTCDPLHPMDSRAKRDATHCEGLHRLIALQMPYSIGFHAL